MENNPHLQNYEPKVEKKVEKIDERVDEKIDEKIAKKVDEKLLEKNAEKISEKELKEKYDSLVLQALGLCIKEEFTASYEKFLEAKKLEECVCFETDFRVDLMINELKKIVH